jgi:hypothetical protein
MLRYHIILMYVVVVLGHGEPLMALRGLIALRGTVEALNGRVQRRQWFCG